MSLPWSHPDGIVIGKCRHCQAKVRRVQPGHQAWGTLLDGTLHLYCNQHCFDEFLKALGAPNGR